MRRAGDWRSAVCGRGGRAVIGEKADGGAGLGLDLESHGQVGGGAESEQLAQGIRTL